jgi:hypothetical protein
MTADPNYKQEIKLVLNSSQGSISKVQGIFLGDNGKNVTVDFTTDGGVNYVGTANFTNPYAMPQIIKGLNDWCDKHGVENVKDLTGTLQLNGK